MESTKLLLCTWFLVFYIISHAMNGISALELMRHLGMSCRTGLLLPYKIMKAMALLEDVYVLSG
jgi:hypothetical protein